jgi:glycosyltransferase involved in cell wall biosynthesis
MARLPVSEGNDAMTGVGDEPRQLRAAYVTTYDPADVRAWSGLGYYIRRCLGLAGIATDTVGPLARRDHPVAQLWRLEARLRGRRYAIERDHRVARAYSLDVARRLESLTSDLVFSPGTIPIAYLAPGRPVALWADATFGAIAGFYPEFRSLSKRALRTGAMLEARALERASVAFYASEWAAKSAVEDHGADPGKVEVVPFGANLPIAHARDDVRAMIHARPRDRCRLLFVGVDWARKGGDRAIEVARLLNERGLPTELHVVGSGPSKGRALPTWVRVHGFVDPSSPDGAAALKRLYASSHVLIHPARAECFGVVFCEAAAHGVVSAASRVGGIPSAVREGVTGALFDVAAPSDEYAAYLWSLLEDLESYERLALSAFDEYERSLSWEAAASRVGPRLAQICS